MLIALALVCAAAGGCVQRRITIRTNPPGALVYIDDYEIGTTPCSTQFTYYGKRKVRLVKDGYETLTLEHRFWPPWYEIIPLDFISENIVPWEIRDERKLSFELRPQQLVPPDQLLERAENLRQGSRTPLVMPGPVYGAQPAAPVPATPPAAIPSTNLPPRQLPPANQGGPSGAQIPYGS